MGTNFCKKYVKWVSNLDITTFQVAALEFFTDLLRELIQLVKDIQSKDFVNFILTIYRTTKLQRCLISFLLTAVSTPNTTSK